MHYYNYYNKVLKYLNITCNYYIKIFVVCKIEYKKTGVMNYDKIIRQTISLNFTNNLTDNLVLL